MVWKVVGLAVDEEDGMAPKALPWPRRKMQMATVGAEKGDDMRPNIGLIVMVAK